MANFDVVLKGGTVIDPKNQLDSLADIGITDGKVSAVELEISPVRADEVVDVSGKWVMPGQIDTHAHVAGLSRNWDPAIGYSMLAKAGTTTVLDMGGTGPTLIDGIKRRGAGLNVAGQFAMIPGTTIPGKNPTRAQVKSIVANALAQGCIGIKILGGYHPFTPEKTAEVIAECNTQTAYVAIHIGTTESGSQIEGVREIPQIVGKGRLHVCHVNSYCRGVIDNPDAECDEAISILESMRGQLNSEAYHALQNGTSGSCDRDGNVMANVPQNCLRQRGYSPTREGMRQAIVDGYASVIGQAGGQIMYVQGKEALKMYDDANTNVGMSFPVNLPSSAFKLATAKNDAGEFVIDAVSTDGGSHPRNVAIQSTMALVQFGALSRLEMAEKLSLAPSRMLGLENKGHFTEGADADITVLDPAINQPVMSLIAGEPIMIDGHVVGKGGTLLVHPAGQKTAIDSGINYQVLDLSKSKLYKNF